MPVMRLSMAVAFSAIVPVLCIAEPTARSLEAERNAQALFDFLLTPRTDIGANRSAQESWLAPGLREMLDDARTRVQSARRSGMVEMGPDPHEPRNSTFLNAWDSPTACEVTGSKAYKDDYLVFVFCGWGKRTNYPGLSGRYALTMKLHSGRWLVDDIRFSIDDQDESTLSGEIRETIAMAKRFESSGRW